MFKYTLDNKRYHTLNYYNNKLYGFKVCKISLNSGLSCPNKDGCVSTKGCIFCDNGSGDFGGNPNKTLIEQFYDIKAIEDKKWPNAKYIVYFQANTNTYAPLNKLKEIYESVIDLPNVIGINIATRSDAIKDDVLDYLSDLNKRTNLTIELGLQSMSDETLKLINRGHDAKNFEDMVIKLKERHIKVVVHIINGLPYETKEMMINTVKYLNDLNIDGIKIHMLSIVNNTQLAKLYETKPFHILTKDEYIDIVCEQLRYLKETIVIHRLTGDPNPSNLVEPKWLIHKRNILNDIDKMMKKMNIYQGDLTK